MKQGIKIIILTTLISCSLKKHQDDILLIKLANQSQRIQPCMYQLSSIIHHTNTIFMIFGVHEYMYMYELRVRQPQRQGGFAGTANRSDRRRVLHSAS